MHKIEPGTYKDLKLKRIRTYTPNEIERAAIEAVFRAAANLRDISQPIAEGDELTVSLIARANDRIIPELCQTNLTYTVGDPKMLECFTAACGHRLYDSFTMTVDFDETCPIPAARSQSVHFEATVDRVRFAESPKLNDAVARRIDPTCETVDELKQKFIKIMQVKYEDNEKQTNLNQILDRIKANSTIELDQADFEQACRETIAQAREIVKNYATDREQSEYLLNEDEYFLEDCREVTARELTEQLILSEIAKREGLELTEAELADQLQQFTESAEIEAEFRRSFPTDEHFREYLQRAKICDFLLANNLIE